MRKLNYWVALISTTALCVSGAWAADTQNGAKLYAQHCASCHGANGKSTVPGVPDFSRSNALFRSDGALFASIKAGKGAMPGFLGILRERDLFDVIAYLRTMI